MADHFDLTIEAMLADIKVQEEKLVEDKKLVNRLAVRAGRQPLFTDLELAVSGAASAPVKKAEFFSKPLTSAIKAYLSRRNQHPATADEIYVALLAGGYDQFATKKEDAINGLRISMGKNAAVFARIPDGDNFLYGLNEWYGITKRAKGASNGSKDEDAGTDADADTTRVKVADEESKGGTDG